MGRGGGGFRLPWSPGKGVAVIQTQSAGTGGAWHWGSGVGWLPVLQMGAPGNKLASLPLLHNLPGACKALGPLPDPEG